MGFLKSFRSGDDSSKEYRSLDTPPKLSLGKAADARENEMEKVQVQLAGMKDALEVTQKVRARLAPAPHPPTCFPNRSPLAMLPRVARSLVPSRRGIAECRGEEPCSILQPNYSGVDERILPSCSCYAGQCMCGRRTGPGCKRSTRASRRCVSLRLSHCLLVRCHGCAS